MLAQGRRFCLFACFTLAIPAGVTLAASTPATASDHPSDETAIRTVLAQSGLLSDALAGTSQEADFGTLHVTPQVHSSEPELTFAWKRGCAQDEAQDQADVHIERWLTGALQIRSGHHAFTKNVHDRSCREVHLLRSPVDGSWRVATLSAMVANTPQGHTELPLANLDTALGSHGFLSVLSDLDELAVCPQTCAVAAPGGFVHVLVGGVDPDAVVMVFAEGQRVAATSAGGSHFEATLHVTGEGLRSVGVTVYSRRSLVDPRVAADARTWVMPLLVRSARPQANALAFDL